MEYKEGSAFAPETAPVKDWGISGQQTGLREVRLHDFQELARYQNIMMQDTDEAMVDDLLTFNDLVENAYKNGPRAGYTWAVTGGSDEIAGPGEVGKIQAVVQMSRNKNGEITKRLKRGGIEVAPRTRVWEASYIKREDAAAHQVSSALRQACVLLLNKLPHYQNDPIKDKINIYLFITPGKKDAENSMRVAESAGFCRVGETEYDEGDETKDLVYALDWSKLDALLKAKDSLGK